jgi:excisionase family DNA binding protein
MEGVLDETRTDALLTDREAAAYMKLATRFGYISVQRWARLGLLRGGKVGDQWRFRKQDLDDFVFHKK